MESRLGADLEVFRLEGVSADKFVLMMMGGEAGGVVIGGGQVGIWRRKMLDSLAAELLVELGAEDRLGLFQHHLGPDRQSGPQLDHLQSRVLRKRARSLLDPSTQPPVFLLHLFYR